MSSNALQALCSLIVQLVTTDHHSSIPMTLSVYSHYPFVAAETEMTDLYTFWQKMFYTLHVLARSWKENALAIADGYKNITV